MRRRCPNALFLGTHYGEVLARTHAAAEVFVHPGRADTCAHTLLEALACGTTKAGFQVGVTREAAGSALVAALES